MVGKLKSLLRNIVVPAASADEEKHDIELACAVLLTEVSRSDYSESSEERRKIERLLMERFDLAAAERQQLLERAAHHADRAVSLHEFTSTLKDSLSEDERGDIVEMLWQVVFADGEVDRYEEHLMRRLADLLYLPHSEFIRRKLEAEKKYRE